MTVTAKPDIETRFFQLMIELFKMDDANALDFGIHRVIRYVNQEVAKFFGEIVLEGGAPTLKGGQLAQTLDAAFQTAESQSETDSGQRRKELEAQLGLVPGMTLEQRELAIEQASSIPAVQSLVEELRKISGPSRNGHPSHSDRTEVLNRLYEFFSRHYQDGDFIVERRYSKDGARYIKSTGEDTEFHWATEGMYYIKAGDVFSDFPVAVGSGQRVVFKVDPDTLKTTRAELQPSDRAHYELKRISMDGQDIHVHLKFLKGAQTEQCRNEIIEAIQQRGNFESLQLRRYLNLFIARNQSDFFIHQRLGDALRDDLDIFVKTEVLDADQLLTETARQPNLSNRAIRVARSVREVARQIIAFVSAIEDFKKALWEKKKLVVESHYIATLDRLEQYCPEWLSQNIDVIIEKQRKAWRELGLGSYTKAAAARRKSPIARAGKSLHYLPLPVDTRNFDAAFKWSLLDNITSAVSLDAALDGIAIKSDNWQALHTIEATYADRVKSIYIDPPYNTDASGIPYKNGYRDASWIAMMENRVRKLHRVLNSGGAIFVSINKVERTNLEHLLDRVFAAKNRIEELVWVQNTNDGRSPTYSTNHEYVEVYAKVRDRVEKERQMFREPKPGYADVMEMVAELNETYPPIAEIEKALRGLYEEHKREYRSEIEAAGLDYEIEKRNDPWKGLFNYVHAEYRDSNGRLVPEKEAKTKQASIWVWRESDWTIMSSEGKQSATTRDPKHPNYRFYDVIHPKTKRPCAKPSRGWKGTRLVDPEHPERISLESLLEDNRIAFGADETKVPQQKRMLHEVDTNVAKSVFVDYSDGEKQLSAMFGKPGLFLAPKHSRFVARFIEQSSGPGDIILDCFGGTGSTAQAVIELNHIEHGTPRKFITIEANRYFDTILVPRLIKAGSATKWQRGNATELNGSGLFMRVQRLEQYDDTLENLDPSIGSPEPMLPFEDETMALRYKLNTSARRPYASIERFTGPFGHYLKCLGPSGNAVDCGVDLLESAAYLIGLAVQRVYRDEQGAVLLGRDRRERSVALFLRDVKSKESSRWIELKMKQHPADRSFCNAAGTLQFPGCEILEPVEAVFESQFDAR